jgi:hypothetical protein
MVGERSGGWSKQEGSMAQTNRLRGQSPQPRRASRQIRTTGSGVAERGRQRNREGPET